MRVLEGPHFTGGGNIGRSYDVSPDAQRFLMLTPGEVTFAKIPRRLPW